MARTSSSLRTSALMNSACAPKARSSSTSALPASSRRPVDDHVRALPGEGDGGGAADAGERTGDQDDGLVHFLSSSTCRCGSSRNQTGLSSIEIQLSSTILSSQIETAIGHYSERMSLGLTS